MLNKKLWLSILLTLTVFGGLVIYGDFRDVGSRLANFPIGYLLAALGLACLNYLLRFFRWAYYLQLLRVDVPMLDSGLVFLAGLAMSITPGKVGEVLKSYLLRRRVGAPVHATAPAVLMERITDVIAIALLGLSSSRVNSGLVRFPYYQRNKVTVVCGDLLNRPRHIKRNHFVDDH